MAFTRLKVAFTMGGCLGLSTERLFQTLEEGQEAGITGTVGTVLIELTLTVVDEEEGDAPHIEGLGQLVATIDIEVTGKAKVGDLTFPCDLVLVDGNGDKHGT